MPRGRNPRGRSPALNPGRVTRAAGKMLASQGAGQGHWRRSHQQKSPIARFCEALKTERACFGGSLIASPVRDQRREVYPCRYGDHWLITTAPAHWHIGRPMC